MKPICKAYTLHGKRCCRYATEKGEMIYCTQHNHHRLNDDTKSDNDSLDEESLADLIWKYDTVYQSNLKHLKKNGKK